MRPITVLGLFDGMSCGQIALKRLSLPVATYYASEIDKYAVSITQKNFPATVQLGDITNLKTTDLPRIDLLMGGSPCQSFSNMGDGTGFDGKSKLFWEFVRVLKETKPKYFLFENVVMRKDWVEIISDELGVQPIKINSGLLSTQRRNRLYWTNIPNVGQPEDLSLDFREIIESVVDVKYQLTPRAVERVRQKQGYDLVGFKSKCLFATYYKNSSNSREGQIIETPDYLRRLTPRECEILQTVPIGYTEGVSDTQRYKMLGNGWTVDVIAHILQEMVF
jgi:site-specific DNA-cytosine methylase|tara:strand:- start:2696 stop:3529 length:834 start_codon:yes stop_codon:yes gene_type:complete